MKAYLKFGDDDVECYFVKAVKDIDCPLQGDNDAKREQVKRYILDLVKTDIEEYGVVDGDDYYDRDLPLDKRIENIIGWMWNRDFTVFDNLRAWCEEQKFRALIWWEGEINMCPFSYPGWIH